MLALSGSWLSALLLSGCAGGTPDRLERVDSALTAEGLYALGLRPDPDPPTVGEALLGIGVTDAEGTALEGVLLDVQPWMPEHGHGVTGEPEITELGAGEYEARWIYSMPGYWELTIQVDGPDGPDGVLVAYDVQ